MGKRKPNQWPELLKLVSQDDGLRVREVGSWTLDKLFFWHRYIDITTTALGKSTQWPGGLVYVDLFGGPGVCVARESRERFPGSALIAAHSTKPFQKIIVCEQDLETADACEKRLMKSPVASSCIVLRGNCNELITEVVEQIPRDSLTLAFVDPTGLHASFDTIRALTENRAVDLLILFADALDVVRNFDRYAGESNSNLDRVLGADANWRVGYSQLARHDGDTLREYFSNVYKKQLRKHLRYRYFGDKVMGLADMPLYRLIFASKHSLGLKFWMQALGKNRRGQRDLFE